MSGPPQLVPLDVQEQQLYFPILLLRESRVTLRTKSTFKRPPGISKIILVMVLHLKPGEAITPSSE